MPTEKRARQRAARYQKQAEAQRRRRRRQLMRRALMGLVLLAVIVGLVVLLSTGGKKPHVAAGTTTSTTTTPSTTVPTPTTQPFNTTAATPVCPSAHETKRVVWFKAAPPNCIGTTSVWDATLDTSAGDFTMRMDAAKSYKAVNNFVFLARWNYYNGTFFHRVVTGFVDQGGDPTGSGTGEVAAKGKVPAHALPGYEFTGNTPPASCAAKKDCYPAGSVAMANTGQPTTNGSQFFVVVPAGTTQFTQPLYTLFGTVTSGMSVVEKINSEGSTSAAGTPRVKVFLLKVVLKQVSS